jgi:hypothetical protein
MQAETTLLALPGIDTVTPAFLCKLVEMSARHGWDPNGIALVISEESGFNPAAKNPKGSASGLIQFIDSTAAQLGTTTPQIRAMSAEEQLPLVEKFFETSLRGKIPERPEDYILSVLGRPSLIGKPDNTPVFTKGSNEYAANSQLDLDSNGVITVGETRAYMQGVLSRAKGTIGSYPSICQESVTPPTSGGASVVAASIAGGALVAGAGYGVYKALKARKPEPETESYLPPPVFRPQPSFNEKPFITKKTLTWLAIGGGGVVSTVLFLTKKKTDNTPPPPSPPPKTYGETVRVTLTVPAGWRRMTSSEVAALPELGAAANTLMNSPGFTTMQYGSLFPFVASDGNTYATWVEQHYHEPGGAVKPWGLHHGVTLLAQGPATLAGAWGLGLTPPAALDLGAATVYDFTFIWDGRQWQVERQGFVIEADIVDHPDFLDRRPFSDSLKLPAPPYRIVSRYYLAEQQGNRFWQHLGMDKNY